MRDRPCFQHVTCLVVVLTVCFLFTPAPADEGMWLLTQVGKLGLKKKGLRIDPSSIFRPNGSCLARASINLGGGTGSFVSDRGLVLTNHHVAYGALQKLSTEKKNYVRDGFLARTLGEEKRAVGYSATLTLCCVDVTARVLEGLAADASSKQRDDHVSERIKEIEKEAGQNLKDRYARVRVAEIHNGGGFILYTTKRYTDVRLVCAPPAAIGEFGGDPDNWMWPRHCGDFSYMRVYASPEGEPARYHEDNVPLKPEVWLKLSTKGVKKGDFTFILGYPARTSRERTSLSVKHHRDNVLPGQVIRLQAMVDALEKDSSRSEKARLRNLSRLKGINNGLKNFRGKVEWMKKKSLVEEMQADEARLQAFIRSRPKLRKKYGKIFDDLADVYRGIESRAKMGPLMRKLTQHKLMRVATVLGELGVEKAKPDGERKRRYKESRLKRLKERTLRGLKDLDNQAEKKKFTGVVKAFAALSDPMLPVVLRKVVKGKTGKARGAALEALSRKIWKGTRLGDVKKAGAAFDLDAGGLKNLKDPMVKFAAALAASGSGRYSVQNVNKQLKLQRRLLQEARSAWKPGLTYPDADRSLRFTYGYVRGYKARDAVQYDYITSLAGAMEKETGVEPFANPKKLVDLFKARDFGRYVDSHVKCVPIAFTHDTDITGGNSGSPVLNARGEMIGIAFDGNWEAITSDYRFDNEMTRTISVDIRYVLFVTEKYSCAYNVLKEMGIRVRRHM